MRLDGILIKCYNICFPQYMQMTLPQFLQWRVHPEKNSLTPSPMLLLSLVPDWLAPPLAKPLPPPPGARPSASPSTPRTDWKAKERRVVGWVGVCEGEYIPWKWRQNKTLTWCISKLKQGCIILKSSQKKINEIATMNP